jgi:hypothetical protein
MQIYMIIGDEILARPANLFGSQHTCSSSSSSMVFSLLASCVMLLAGLSIKKSVRRTCLRPPQSISNVMVSSKIHLHCQIITSQQASYDLSMDRHNLAPYVCLSTINWSSMWHLACRHHILSWPNRVALMSRREEIKLERELMTCQERSS